MRTIRSIGIAVALLAVAPASAVAAGSVSSNGAGSLTYTGDGGANVLVVTGTQGSPGTVTFSEPGITEGTDTANECTPATDLITCDKPSGAFILVSGGAGADDLTVNGNSPATLQGGTENDRLTGGESSDELDGEAGSDQVFGRGSRDFAQLDEDGGDVTDLGGGADIFFAQNGDGGGDTLRGGSGVDTLSYGWTGTPVAFRIDLAAGTMSHDGTPAEAADALDGIEDVNADDFLNNTMDDTLIGSSSANVLAAGTGNDTVVGGPGSDRLLPDSGEGVFGLTETGAGNDTVLARDGFGDQIVCGRGADTAQIDQFDAPLMDQSCENVQQADLPAFGITPTPAPDATAPSCKRSRLPRQRRSRFLRSGFVVAYTCNEQARLDLSVVVRVKRSRGGKVVLSRAGDLVVAERHLGFSTKTRKVRLKVARSLKRALGKRFKVTVRAVAADRAGNQRTTSASFAVR
jgi:Ca2+-binding RTX toxin-like protein